MLSKCVQYMCYVHKVGFILELHNGLEDQSPATHPQQAAGVLAVSKHSACGETA